MFAMKSRLNKQTKLQQNNKTVKYFILGKQIFKTHMKTFERQVGRVVKR